MKTKHWILLFAVLLGAAALVFLWGKAQKPPRVTAQILQEGRLIREIRLDEIKEESRFTIQDAEGHYNIVRVEPGRICIQEADCPDKLCVKQGWLSEGITPLVCLPHKLIIQLMEGAP
ncbi:MAG: NusG domain II-containing protein [Lachnospiraceae bacterium]|nr:NusG domain II-containing protein [Lachnospiraceae bacterium]